MFEKILLATDLSAASDRVICAAAGLKKLGAREALLVHCLNIRDVGALANRLIELAKPALERQRQALESRGLKVEARLALGLPQIEITREAEEHHSELIVVGSHGETTAAEVSLGSVANLIIQHAALPVLLLRLPLQGEAGRRVCEEWECDCLRKILFPTDFSDNAEHAFQLLARLVERGAREVDLLHVQDQTRIDRHLRERLAEFNAIDRERLERMKKTLIEKGAERVDLQIPYGAPKKEIIARVTSGGYSLVVLGSQGRGYFGEIFLGSVSHYVARRSPTPVLLVPPPR